MKRGFNNNHQNYGEYAAIKTAYPTIGPNGFSYMRVGNQRIINGNVYYVEIGWIRSSVNMTPTS